MLYISASPISDGIGIGKILVLQEKKDPQQLKAASTEAEKQKFADALNKVAEKIQAQIELLTGEKKEILGAHLLMAEDPEWCTEVESFIENESCNAAYAVNIVGERTADFFKSMDSEYFRERAADILDISESLIDILENRQNIDLAALEEPTIIFANELLPSQTVLLNKETVRGILSCQGGQTSHTAIMAKALGIPMLSGAKEALDSTFNGKKAIISVKEGVVLVDPEPEILSRYQKRIQNALAEEASLASFINEPSRTACGDRLEIACNIALPKEVENVLKVGAEGIGLFRSEFLYMDRPTPPSLDEQVKAYKTVLEAMDGKSVIIRTMDLGGDKAADYLGIPKEANPFLGLRAIRYCLRQPDLFKTQIKALYLASSAGNLKIMLPMIATVNEVRNAKKLIEEVRAELKAEGKDFAPLPLGIMIEIPAAALMADILAEEVDFFSIGTNDLIQYTMAVDRMNANISDLYSYYDPAFLRLLHLIAKVAKEKKIWLGMCGDVAGDPLLAPYLIALGFNELSVTPPRVLALRREIKSLRRDNEALINAILTAKTAAEVQSILSSLK